MYRKKSTIFSLLILLYSSLSLAQNTITYNLDGGSSTNPTSYEQSDIATVVTIAVYDLVNGQYVENSFSEDLVYSTGIQCQTWSRSKKDGGINYNAATDVSFNTVNSSITWTEYGPEGSQESIDATCATGVSGVTKTVIDGEYLLQDQGTQNGQDPFYLGIKSVEYSTIVLTDAVKDGYTFEGWYTNAEYTNSITEIVDGTEGNIELYAKFQTTTGILNSKTTAFSFYPNPNTGIINTELELSSLEVMNAQGVVLYHFNSSGSIYDISNLESGIYTIKAIGTNGNLYTSKLLKK